jgi:L-histidine N-alpha-methyltransferase
MDTGFRARRGHVVAIPEFEVSLRLDAAEALRLEISAKFRREVVDGELAAAGLRLDHWWTDDAGDFALALARSRDAEEL